MLTPPRKHHNIFIIWYIYKLFCTNVPRKELDAIFLPKSKPILPVVITVQPWVYGDFPSSNVFYTLKDRRPNDVRKPRVNSQKPMKWTLIENFFYGIKWYYQFNDKVRKSLSQNILPFDPYSLHGNITLFHFRYLHTHWNVTPLFLPQTSADLPECTQIYT